ncbi:MAG: iron-containing alcohol dehydrogenase [Pseudomonadales bacterium]|nr:iron-containing alcohol dehydrogenase [Pseudomonadales bacterium]
MAKDYYEFFCPVKIVAGLKALEHVPYELSSHGSSNPLIITDKGVRSVGLVDHVTKAMDAAQVSVAGIYEDVPPDSSTSVVTQCARYYREQGADSIVAIGGGSVIDTAKAVNILVSEGGDDLKAYSGAGNLKRPLKPFFVIPTTAGTGSETTLVSVIKDDDTGTKMPFVSHFLLPDVAVLDPRMTLSLPPKITAATAMDALTHAVEAFTCLAKNPVSDSYATAAIKKISENLVDVLNEPSNVEGRLELAQAATMAGIAFSNSMVGLVHALGHNVGAVAHVPHGVCMSILMPYVLEFNLAERADTIGDLLLHLAGPDVYASIPSTQRAEKAIERIREMKEQVYSICQLPRTLSETGAVQRSDLPKIAQMSLDDASMLLNPIDATYEQALEILQQAF